MLIDGYIYIDDELVSYYREWTNQPRPKYFRRQRKMGECFGNAGRLAVKHAELTYCEGIASDPWFGYLEHAWCVDLDGRVIDQTWLYDPLRKYFGIPFKAEWLYRALARNRCWFSTLHLIKQLGTDYIRTDLLISR